MNSLDLLVETATTAFHDEYRRNFPAGGDAGDHDEATRAGIEAVIVAAHAPDPRLRVLVAQRDNALALLRRMRQGKGYPMWNAEIDRVLEAKTDAV